MSFWKVLAGAATGVAVVVALPIAGPVGAVTAIGAAVAGTAGAAGGALADAIDDSEELAEKRGKKKGEEKARAEYALKLEKIIKKFEKWAKDWHRYGNKLVATTAVGLACANCDGEIHKDELTEINEFVAGVTQSDLPEGVKKQIEKFRQKPPSLKTAHELAKKAKVDFDLLNGIIDVVMHADGRVHPKERAFLTAWQKLCA